MTNEEIQKEIESLEFRILITKHADYLSSEDWIFIKNSEQKIKELREMLK